MLHNNLEVGERPEELIVYGGSGRAARSWADFDAIVATLRRLEQDQTLVIQSGRPVAVFTTHARAPRVVMANSNLVPRWATAEHFRQLESAGLMMYGQMTAGSWCYIGTQGIVQGTYETFAAVARRHFKGTLAGRLCLSAGLGGMGGAQPLAITLNGGVALVVEVDPSRIDRRVAAGYCQRRVDDLEQALKLALAAKERKEALSIGLLGNAAEVYPRLLERDLVPDVVTDQTSAHDALRYVPLGLSIPQADALREEDGQDYARRAVASMVAHCGAMVRMHEEGAVVFDYGNNLRGQAQDAGLRDAFSYPGFVVAYLRPMFCEGRGPFRWVCLSGEATDLQRTDELVLELFGDDQTLHRWITLARQHVPIEGLPARVCWLGLGQRARFALALNDLVRRKQLRAPIAITRDHLDTGSVASPNRETEGMRDGSDAVADWPLLNALLNTAAGADSVQIHSGGGVGVGLSVHAGMVVVCDGSSLADDKITAVFATDPGIGVARHADAGYGIALRTAAQAGLDLPYLECTRGAPPGWSGDEDE